MRRSVGTIAISALVLGMLLVPAAASFAQGQTVASDGQSLSGQPAATQAMFNAVWGTNANAEWVREHDASLQHQTLGPSPYPMAGGAPSQPTATPATGTLQPIAIPPITGKTGSFDIMVIDQKAHRMYVADRTTNGVDVFDVSTAPAKFINTIETGSGPNGVVVAPEVNKIFAGLNDSTLAVIDIAPNSSTLNHVVARIETGGSKRADELDYDPKDGKVYVANSDDGIVTVVNASTNAVMHQYAELGPGLEQPRYDSADGMMYMTSSDQNVVYKFDPRSDTQVGKYELSDKCNPNGLDIDPSTNQGLLGCSNTDQPHTDLMDMSSGNIVASYDQVGASDEVVFNAAANRFFTASSNDPRGPAVGIFTANPPAYVTQVATAPHAHAVAYDETNKWIYVPDQRDNSAELLGFLAPDTAR